MSPPHHEVCVTTKAWGPAGQGKGILQEQGAEAHEGNGQCKELNEGRESLPAPGEVSARGRHTTSHTMIMGH